MIWLEKKTDKGVLKYRMPNIPEGLFMLSLTDDMTTAQGVFRTRSKIVENLNPLLDISLLDYSSHKEMLNDSMNMWEPLNEIANEIMKNLNEVLTKKH